eukprot:TRINITY_DN6576_c0_g1_i1.p1 TRINITY_DN6576_c0_g1~~TRINITY_DN6576_c0_g1_i1.p1  ORF type:complete len:294 (+),score=43.31 TRINITY_DN6576_c0_g1_i1:511-1392(+)
MSSQPVPKRSRKNPECEDPALPLRFSCFTWNIWKKGGKELHDWERRRPALQAVISRFQPDILCVQEAHKLSLEALAEVLPNHQRVLDVSNPGWESESNIFWNSSVFAKEAHGTADAGIDGIRSVFWVLLRAKALGGHLLVATAHLTWQGAPGEGQGGPNPRVAQSESMAKLITDLAKPNSKLSDMAGVENFQGAPVLLMGDFNEGFFPRQILEGHGFVDCFKALGLPATATHPQRPCADDSEESLADHVLDWIFMLNQGEAKNLRCLLAQVLKGVSGGYASDHMPVSAVYELA